MSGIPMHYVYYIRGVIINTYILSGFPKVEKFSRMTDKLGQCTNGP